LWKTIGKKSSIDTDLLMKAVVAALQDGSSENGKKRTATSDVYKRLMKDKAVLLVIDDVWQAGDIGPWLTESARSRVLFTTQDDKIAGAVGARQHWADLLSGEQSREMFARWAGVDKNHLSALAQDIVDQCGQLPLALAMVGAMLRGRSKDLWQRTLDLLRQGDLEKIKAQFPGYPHPNLFLELRAGIHEELARCQDAVAAAVRGAQPRWMRPPYGYRNPLLDAEVRRAGMQVVLWSKICWDWKPQPPRQLVERLASVARTERAHGDVVVLHDGDHRALGADRGHVVAALEHWLPRWRDAGMEFVTMDLAASSTANSAQPQTTRD